MLTPYTILATAIAGAVLFVFDYWRKYKCPNCGRRAVAKSSTWGWFGEGTMACRRCGRFWNAEQWRDIQA